MSNIILSTQTMNTPKVILDAMTLHTSFELISNVRKTELNRFQKSCFYNLLSGILLWDKFALPPDTYVHDILESLIDDPLANRLCRFFSSIDQSSTESYETLSDWLLFYFKSSNPPLYTPFKSKFRERQSSGDYTENDKYSIKKKMNEQLYR